jgi:hypothetical protein
MPPPPLVGCGQLTPRLACASSGSRLSPRVVLAVGPGLGGAAEPIDTTATGIRSIRGLPQGVSLRSFVLDQNDLTGSIVVSSASLALRGKL